MDHGLLDRLDAEAEDASAEEICEKELAKPEGERDETLIAKGAAAKERRVERDERSQVQGTLDLFSSQVCNCLPVSTTVCLSRLVFALN